MVRNERIAGIFSRLASFSARRPLLVLAVSGALTLASVVSIRLFPPTSDASRMVPSGTPALALIRDMMEAFKLGGDADVVVRGKPAALTDFARNFKEEISSSKAISHVSSTYAEQFKIEEDPLFIARMLLNLEPDAFDRLLHYTTPKGLREVVSKWKGDRSRVPREALGGEPVLLQHFVADAVLEKSAPLWLTNRPMTSKDGEWLRIKIEGARPAADVDFSRKAVADIEVALARAMERTPGIEEAIVVGGYTSAVENQRSVKRDIVQTLVISGALVLVLFLVGFRQAGSLMHVGLPLAMGITCAFGICAPLLREMYLGSVAFACILVGLGVDYPIHLYNQMTIELSRNSSWREALSSSAAAVGPGAMGAALTTIAAFSLFLFLPFRPLVELGAIASVGLALCVLATFTVLPALLSLRGGKAAKAIGRAKIRHLVMPRLVRFASRHGGTICAVAAAVIVSSLLVLVLVGRPGIPFTFEMGKFVPTSPQDIAKRDRVEGLFPSAARPSLVIAWRATNRHEAFMRGIELRRILEPMRGKEIADYHSPLRLYRTTEVYRRNLSKAREALLTAPIVERLDDAIRDAGENPKDFESSRAFLSSLKEVLAGREVESQIGDLEAPMWSSFVAEKDGGFIGIIPLAIERTKQNPSDLRRIAGAIESKLGSLGGGWANLSGWLVLEREI
nr:MMPL family transporter [bacterium]